MVVERSDAAFTVSVNGGTSEHGGGGDLSTVSGTAISGPDYTAPSRTLTLDAGASSATITIRTLDDMLPHRGELLVVVPTGTTTSTGAVTGESTAAQTTIDDQGTITVSVTADATAVTQGDGATFTVTLSGAVANALAVGSSMSDRTATSRTNYTVRQTATSGTDYTALSVTRVGGLRTSAATSTTMWDVGFRTRGGTARARASGPARIQAVQQREPPLRSRGLAALRRDEQELHRRPRELRPAPEVPERAGRPGQHDQPPRGRRHAERQLGGNLRSSHSLRGSCGQPSGPRRSTTSPRLRSRLVRFRRKINPWPKAD